MIEELKFLLIHVSLYYFNAFLISIDSRGYNPNKNTSQNNPISFNPITNLPLTNYKGQPKQIRKEINEYNNQNIEREKYNNFDNYQQLKTSQREQAPMEYNPYKRPYSIYQGHP